MEICPTASEIKVFHPWKCPNGENEQMTVTLHNYRCRQIHRTSNRENSSSGLIRIICVLQRVDPTSSRFDKFLAHGEDHMEQMQLYAQKKFIELWMEKICPVVSEICLPQSLEQLSACLKCNSNCNEVISIKLWTPPDNEYSFYKDFMSLSFKFYMWCSCMNKANLRDLIAATGLVILLKIGLKSSIFLPM